MDGLTLRTIGAMAMLVVMATGSAVMGQSSSRGPDLLEMREFHKATEHLTVTQRYELAATMYIAANRFERAALLLDVLVHEPANRHRSELWALLAHSFNRMNQPGRGYDAAHVAILLDPHREYYYLERGIAAAVLSRSDQAIEDLTRYIEHYSYRSEAHFYLGLALAQKGMFDPAREHLEKSSQLSPLMILPATYYLGLIDMQKGEATSAHQRLLQACEALSGHQVAASKDMREQVQITGQIGLAHSLKQAVHEMDVRIAANDLPVVIR